MRARLFAISALWFICSACTGTSSSISVTAPTAAKCEVAVENASADAVPPDGMSGTLAISTNRDCTWTAAAKVAWIAITSPASGQGSGSLGYRVGRNPDPTSRRGVLQINNTDVAVVQDAAPCTYSVSPANTTVSANGREVPVAIETLTGCAWTARSSVGWIALPANASGNASATLTLTVAANTATVPRTGAVAIGPQTVTIQQAAATPNPDPTPAPTPTPPAPCVFGIAPTSNSVGSDGSTGTIQVTAGRDCAWTATENTSWLTVTSGASGSGDGMVNYRVAANAGAARSGTLTVAGKTFTIAQAAAPPPACTFSISPTSLFFGAVGGVGSIAITSSANTCAWTATTSAPWITVTAGQSGTGNGTVAFTVAVNTGSVRRATIAAGGKTFTVTQEEAPPPPPPPCTFTIAPTAQDVADTGGTGSVAVTASASTCAWIASANAAWLTVTSGATGTGNGSVAFAAAVNTAAARTGTLTIAGQTFSVSQTAPPPPPPPPPCTFMISPATQSVPSEGGNGSVAVTASAATCTWTAMANVDWLTVLHGSSGTGSDTVAFTVAPNVQESDRMGTITIAGQTFTVTQQRP